MSLLFKALICLQIYLVSSLIVGSKFHGNFVLTPCTTDEDCSDLGNSTCNNNYCRCENSSICEAKQNLVVTKIGEKCNAHHDCNIVFSECSKNKECVCRANYTSTANRRKCLEVVESIGGDCEDHVQCQATHKNSACLDSKCSCNPGFHVFGNQCYKSSGLHETCQNNKQCIPTENSSCKNSKCECDDGFVSSDMKCLPVAAGLNAPCQHDDQCKAKLGGSSHCLRGMCVCQEFYTFKKTQQKCYRDKFLDEICVMNADCHQPDNGVSRLECILGTCKCKSPYTEVHGYCIQNSTSNLPLFSKMLLTFFGFLILSLSYL